jgi:hypothetical protein
MILPEDITERVSSFTSGNTIFPSVKKDEFIITLILEWEGIMLF